MHKSFQTSMKNYTKPISEKDFKLEPKCSKFDLKIRSKIYKKSTKAMSRKQRKLLKILKEHDANHTVEGDQNPQET